MITDPLHNASILLIALLLDAAFGEPEWIWSRYPHPAVLIGRVITRADKLLNRGTGRKIKGLVLVCVMCLVAWLVGRLTEIAPGSGFLEALLAGILIAQRSLADHVRAVARGLCQSVEEGRRAVSRIVGRDTAGMGPEAIARSAIESAAENLSDAVVAPAFWFLLLGLPGLLVYKAVNTADSMIGYLNDNYRDFGWAAARLDDLLNWIPARLTALLILATRMKFGAFPAVLRDAPLHRSPNAGWPEAAMASVLNVALSGPRSYDGVTRDFPFVFAEGRHDLGAGDIKAAVAVLWQVWAALAGFIAILAILGTVLAL